jgi:hypothetical protein
MAKRARGTTTRPGQRAPLQRTVVRPGTIAPTAATPAAPRPSGLTTEEEARAAELEARIVADERAADDSRRRSDVRRKSGPVETAPMTRLPGGLAVRAAEEYAYVGRDVRRITTVGGSLIGLLVVLWILSHLLGLGPI